MFSKGEKGSAFFWAIVAIVIVPIFILLIANLLQVDMRVGRLERERVDSLYIAEAASEVVVEILDRGLPRAGTVEDFPDSLRINRWIDLPNLDSNAEEVREIREGLVEFLNDQLDNIFDEANINGRAEIINLRFRSPSVGTVEIEFEVEGVTDRSNTVTTITRRDIYVDVDLLFRNVINVGEGYEVEFSEEETEIIGGIGRGIDPIIFPEVDREELEDQAREDGNYRVSVPNPDENPENAGFGQGIDTTPGEYFFRAVAEGYKGEHNPDGSGPGDGGHNAEGFPDPEGEYNPNYPLRWSPRYDKGEYSS